MGIQYVNTSATQTILGNHQLTYLSPDVTDKALGFVFSPRPSMFPNPMAPNLTANDVPGQAIQNSFLQIQQFDEGEMNRTTSNDAMDASDMFMVYPREAMGFVDYAVGKENERWEKKFNLGVGLGIGLSFLFNIIITWALITWCTKRSNKKRTATGKNGA